MIALLGVLVAAQAATSDVVADGAVASSSNFVGYAAADGVDGDLTTSWFSDGAWDGPTEQFTWTADHTEWVDQVVVQNNALNAQGFVGFGFETVDVVLRDRGGAVTFAQTVPLPGDTDPLISVSVGAFGESLELNYTNHDDPACGGFSELEVWAERDALLLTPIEPGTAGGVNDALVLNGTPGEAVLVGYATSAGITPVPGCPGLTVPLGGPTVVDSPAVGADGVATAQGAVPAGASGLSISVVAVELATCRASNVIHHTFP